LLFTKARWQYDTDWSELVNLILEKCVPRDDTQNENDVHRGIRKRCTEYTNCNLEPDISIEEIEKVIKNLKKAPEMDGFTREVHKMLWSRCWKVYVEMFNNCLRSGSFPDE